MNHYLVQIILTVVDVALLVVVLVYFLIRLTAMLTRINSVLVQITGGVRAIEDHCRIIGFGADAVNAALASAAGSLTTAAVAAEGMAPAKR